MSTTGEPASRGLLARFWEPKLQTASGAPVYRVENEKPYGEGSRPVCLGGSNLASELTSAVFSAAVRKPIGCSLRSPLKSKFSLKPSRCRRCTH